MREDRMYLREEMVALKADVLTMREEARNSQTEMREDRMYLRELFYAFHNCSHLLVQLFFLLLT